MPASLPAASPSLARGLVALLLTAAVAACGVAAAPVTPAESTDAAVASASPATPSLATVSPTAPDRGPAAAPSTAPTPPAATVSPAVPAAALDPEAAERPGAVPSVPPSSAPPGPAHDVHPTAAAAEPPSVATFWERAGSAVRVGAQVVVRVDGPVPGELRYEAVRSATVAAGEVVFVCGDGRAWDGQSGFASLPGRWTCGADALVEGFRRTGQPLDAWSPELPDDEGIREATSVDADGAWRWTYRAHNASVGGEVRTVVVLDPATGRIRLASRTDPVGETTYRFAYRAAVPPIELP